MRYRYILYTAVFFFVDTLVVDRCKIIGERDIYLK